MGEDRGEGRRRVSVEERKKRDARDVRAVAKVEGRNNVPREPMQSTQRRLRPIVYSSLGATIRAHGTVSAFSRAANVPLTIMHPLLRRQIIRS